MEKKYIIWIILGAFLLALAFVSGQPISYEAPNYTNVTLVLEADYAAPNYTNVTLILGEFADNPPSVTLRSPIDNAYLTSTSVTFNCTASDDIQLSNVTLYGNWTGSWLANETNSSGVNADYIFSKTINDSIGNIWNCYACDNASQCSWGVSNRTFNVDLISPIITVLSPENITYNYSTIWFNASANEAIDTWIVNYNGTNVTHTINTSLEVEDGDHQLLLYGNDSAGNWGLNDSIYFIVDLIDPSLTITYPVNNSYINTNLINITGTASDNHPDAVVINDTGFGTNQGTYSNWNFTNSSLDEGAYSIKITANDTAERETSDVVIFTIDTINPLISIVYPLNNTYSSDVVQGINYTVSDINLDSCWYSNDTYSINTTLVSCANITNVNWTEGQHNVTIWANDSAGNENSSSITFFIDSIYPIIIWEDPTPGDSIEVSENYVYLNTTITDASDTSAFFDWNKSLVGYWAFDYYNSTGIFDNSSYSTFGIFNGSMGISNIVDGKRGKASSFNGIDEDINLGDSSNVNFGNGSFAMAAWIYSNSVTGTQQIIAKDSLGQGRQFNFQVQNNGEIRFRYFSGGGGVFRDTTDTVIVTDTWQHVLAQRVGDTLEIFVDGIEQNGTTSGTFGAIDDASVALTIGKRLYPSFENFFNGTIDEVVIWNRSLSEEEVGALYNVEAYRLENNFTNLSDGVYNYSAYAIDSAGNLNITQDRQVTVDTTLPKVQFVDPTTEEGSYFQLWIEANVTASDIHLDTITIYLYNSTGLLNSTSSSSSPFYINFTNLTIEGDYYLNATANDTAGNLNYTETRFIQLFAIYGMNMSLTTNDFIFNVTNATGIFEPINQTNETGIISVHNNESITLNVTIELNETYPGELGNITVYANDEYNYSTADIVNTTSLQVITALTVNDSTYIWMWANYTDPRRTWFPEITVIGMA